jgi:hypothetical protein
MTFSTKTPLYGNLKKFQKTHQHEAAAAEYAARRIIETRCIAAGHSEGTPQDDGGYTHRPSAMMSEPGKRPTPPRL